MVAVALLILVSRTVRVRKVKVSSPEAAAREAQ
jgi:hypothetical protein